MIRFLFVASDGQIIRSSIHFNPQICPHLSTLLLEEGAAAFPNVENPSQSHRKPLRVGELWAWPHMLAVRQELKEGLQELLGDGEGRRCLH